MANGCEITLRPREQRAVHVIARDYAADCFIARLLDDLIFSANC